jgi:hypothetical protein
VDKPLQDYMFADDQNDSYYSDNYNYDPIEVQRRTAQSEFCYVCDGTKPC